MKENYTHIVMVVDRSGSMTSSWKDVQGGYSELIKTNKDATGECTFSLAVFDDNYDLLEDFTPIEKVDEKLKTFPRGGTALLDAIGRTIKSVGAKLAKLDEDQRPDRVMVYILSDGQENSSREFKKEDVEKMIKTQESEYSWVFNYVGATLASVNDAVSFGIKSSHATYYNAENSGNAFSVLGEKMLRMRSVSNEQYAATCMWSVEEKESLES
jgi:uncharacterized protein YegL